MASGTLRIAIPALRLDDHIRGSANAPVTLLEYGDFECPQCAQAYPIVRELQDFFGDRLRVVFRNFPLTNVHTHAQRAAETAEWAASLGKFWPMHDALYEQQDRLSDDHLLALAKRLGLDPAALRAAWDAHTFFPRVKEEFLAGIRGGVTGTPSFFIDGVRVEGPWDYQSLTRAIHEAIRVSGQAATPPDPAPPAPDVTLPR